MFIAYDPQMWL